MRNLFIYLLVISTVFVSCRKEETVDVENLQSKKVNSENIYVKNGYLVFHDYGFVDKTVELLNTFSLEQRDAWEKELGYTSIRKYLQDAVYELEQCNSEQKYNEIKQKYTGRVRFMEDGDVDFLYDDPYMAPFINKDGLVEVGGTLLKYTKDRIIYIADGDFSKIQLALNSDKSEPKEGIFIQSYNELKENLKVINGWGTIASGSYSTSDRRLEVNLVCNKIYQPIWSPTAGYYTQIKLGYHIYQEMIAKKKGLFGWRKYNTIFQLLEGEFFVLGDKHVYYSNQTFGSAATITITLSNKYYYEPFNFLNDEPAFPSIVKIYTLNSSQGIGTNTVEILAE